MEYISKCFILWACKENRQSDNFLQVKVKNKDVYLFVRSH